MEAGGVFSTSKRGAAAWNRKTEKSEVQHQSLKSLRERGPTYIGQQVYTNYDGLAEKAASHHHDRDQFDTKSEVK